MSAITLNIPTFQDEQLAWMGNKILYNETSGDKTKLVFWNPNEPEYASLGVHNLWLIKGCRATYLEDSFTKFLQECQKQGIELPEWLRKNQTCPWANREAFLQEDPQKLEQLRTFLWNNKAAQFKFIIANFHRSFPNVIGVMPESLRSEAIEYCNILFGRPEGCFALVDYMHFKGGGTGEYPQYFKDDSHNDPVCLSAQLGCMNTEDACTLRGWGLVQVITLALRQQWQENPLESFISSAKTVLLHRVLHAQDKRKNEHIWVAGWNNRLDRYRDIS